MDETPDSDSAHGEYATGNSVSDSLTAEDHPLTEPLEASPQSIYTARICSLILGALYVFAKNPLELPCGVFATFWYSFLLLTFYVLRRKHIQPVPKSETAVLALGVLNCSSFFFTTNALILALNSLVVLFLVLIMAILLAEGAEFPFRSAHFVLGSLRTLGAASAHAFDSRTRSAFRGSRFRLLIPWKRVLQRSILSILVLWFFHVFFADINDEYLTFASLVLSKIYHFLEYIFDVEFWLRCTLGVTLAYFLFALFTVRTTATPKCLAEWTLKDSMYTVVGAVVVLFFIFSTFQTKLLYSDVSKMSFKSLSLYTQQGFWSLLIVAVFGYLLLLFSLWQKPLHTEEKSSWKYLLAVFNVELFFICLFTFHKLGVLQHYFGFKDQRIVATLAVLLITMTFLLSLGRLAGRIGDSTVFQIQSYCLVFGVLFLSAINVDAMATRINPIGYYVNETKYKDYSYLLTNSLDNVSEWPSLMAEAEQTGIPVPDNYYWGKYSSLCGTDSRSVLRDRQGRLVSRYSQMLSQPAVETLSTFNLREYQAYRFMQDNRERLEGFSVFVEAECLKHCVELKRKLATIERH